MATAGDPSAWRNQHLNCEALENRQLLSGFFILSLESGKALDNTGSSTSNGNLIEQYQPTGGLDQVWNLISLPDGYDEIVNASSGKVLDDTGFSASNGTLIQQWSYVGGLNQQWKIVPLAGGNDEIQSAYSGLALDDTGSSTSNGTDIEQWQYWGGVNQQWRLLAAGNTSAVTDYVVDASSGKVLDDTNRSTENGTLMQQFQLTGGADQRWTFISLADGNDLIVDSYSGLVLDDTGSSTSDGTKIQQWQAWGGLNQQWHIVALADGNNEIVNAYSSLVLDDTNASTENGNLVQQWQANGGISEQWNLLAAGNAALTNYVVNATSGLVLDNPEFPASNGTDVQQDHLTMGSNQQWIFIPLADGDDLIVSAYSGKVLEDPGSSIKNGTLIEQFQPNASLNQQWWLDNLADGNDAIFNANSDEVLDDTNSSTSDGTLIQQWSYWGGTNQQWNISPYANPVASQPYVPVPTYIPLFNGGQPSYLDVRQGNVGDCWLLASLAEVAAREPGVIESMFTKDGTTVDNGSIVGAYSVRFYNSGGSAFFVPVDTDLPSGGSWYDDLTSGMGTVSLWVALAEKAYAEANALGYVTTHWDGQDSYGAMNNGDPSWALQAITGQPSTDFDIGSPSQVASSLAADWNAGRLIVLGTISPLSSEIVPDHGYAVVGYNASSSDPFELFNPWGSTPSGFTPTPDETIPTLGLFWENAEFISQNFSSMSVDSGTADANAIDTAIDEITKLSPLGGLLDPSGTIHSARQRLTGRAVAPKPPARHL